MAVHNFNWSKVNWMQAGVEASLLLAGVLLALAGQAWWENREDHETIREYAANLRLEVSANRNELHKAIGRHEAYIEAGKSLIGGIQSQHDAHLAPSLRKHFSKIGWVSDFRPATSALKNLVGAGGLGLLESTELQLAVSKYAQSIDDHNVLQTENTRYFFETYVPFISQRVSLLDIEFVSKDLELPKRSRFSTNVKPLFESMVFENLVVTRLSNELDAKHYAERFRRASEELLGVLQELGL